MDYVLPYVDCTDPVWREDYRRVNSSMGMEECRFRPFGTLKYAFRSVAKNMPFIDRIVLIVSTESQVPIWVNRDKVRIVTHDEFMPEAHRPTFSSSAIESEMWRINGLSPRFIYANDDFFALQPMDEDGFFCGDLPRLVFTTSDFNNQNVFQCSCRNGMDMAADAAGHDRTDARVLLKPQHCMKGITVDHMKTVGRICADKIENTITVRRHRWNVTGYIYHYYAFYTRQYAPFTLNYRYALIANDYQAVTDLLKDPEVPILCINDSVDLDNEHYEEASQALVESFDRLFHERCVYELP